MCCKPGTPPALTSEQRDISFQVRTLSLTSVSKVIGSRQELDSDMSAPVRVKRPNRICFRL